MMASVTAPRPVIGLTTSEIRLPGRAEQIPHADAGRHELVLGLSYMQALGAAGAAPVILAPLDPDDVPSMLSSLSGVCLPGGPDIDPVEYGAERDADPGATDRALAPFVLVVARGAGTSSRCSGRSSRRPGATPPARLRPRAPRRRASAPDRPAAPRSWRAGRTQFGWRAAGCRGTRIREGNSQNAGRERIEAEP